VKEINIAGGGIAGLSLGIALRRQNVPVVVHEAGSYPRDKVCGGIVHGVAPSVFDELGVSEFFLKKAIRINSVAFYNNGEKLVQIPFPPGAYSISRRELDWFLAKKLEEEGGRLQTHSRVRTIGEGVVLATGRSVTPHVNGWRYFGLKCLVSNVQIDPTVLQLHFFENGYIGLASTGPGEANLCGLFRSRLPVSELKSQWQQYLKGPSGSPLSETLQKATFESQSLHTMAGLSAKPAKVPNCPIRIGDAASMIAPFTGRGMAIAFQTALLAAPPITNYARGEVSWSSAGDAIARSYRQGIRFPAVVASFLQDFLFLRAGNFFRDNLLKIPHVPGVILKWIGN